MFKKGNIPWNKGKEGRQINHNISGLVRGRYKGKTMPPAWNKGLKGYHAGKNHSNWHGGKQKTGNGYIMLLLPEHPGSDKRGRYYEHRYLMEQKLGRYLIKGEVVDHINGIRNDNRIENLRLFSSNKEHLNKTRHNFNTNPWVRSSTLSHFKTK